ncbi:hypothetical protein GY45DRAFT_1250927 [Cubamyces sp. BRFM 1775]|nr:hypothetical protein GY45DRAFT_1250927 [Cubamyces sp. BRFM 1775]
MAVEPSSSSRTSADSRTDFIEQIFQKVEEETERRAQAQQEYEDTQSRLQSRIASPAPVAAPTPRDGPRDRRRGSISVSRFGQATDLASHTHDNPSTLPSRTNSVIINAGNTGAFYQAQRYAGSADSFASSVHSAPHDEEHEQVTQMETIAGKVSIGRAVGGIIARRLSRSRTRSRDILATPNGLVIGVSVEEATTEAEAEGETDVEGEADGVNEKRKGAGAGLPPKSPRGTSFVYAQADGLRSRRSTLSMPGGTAANGASGDNAAGLERRLSAVGWVAKAKDLTKKFRRKSMAVLPQNSSP